MGAKRALTGVIVATRDSAKVAQCYGISEQSRQLVQILLDGISDDEFERLILHDRVTLLFD